MDTFGSDTGRRGRGFSMIEMLVVVSLIALLGAILLVAMSGVRRRAVTTRTESTMQEFSRACDAFRLVHGRYPGIAPEHLLASVPSDVAPHISGTENALLDLMGGARVYPPAPDSSDPDIDGDKDTNLIDLGADWTLQFDVSLMGQGPVVDGRRYTPYLTPRASVLLTVGGQVNEPPPPEDQDVDGPLTVVRRIPDLVDAWGQPIIYLRQVRTTGPLVGIVGDSPAPQFYAEPLRPYVWSTKLGVLGRDQTAGANRSILNSAPDPNATLAQIIRHPIFGDFGNAARAQAGLARGAYALISAGADGIFFSRADGPGTPQAPVDDIVGPNSQHTDPRVVEDYDDITLFGGG